jgi:hypothetical protein
MVPVTAPGTPAAAPGGAPVVVDPGAAPVVAPNVSTGVLGDARIGGIGGGIPKGLDRGLGGFDFGANALVAFQSNRLTGGGNDVGGDCCNGGKDGKDDKYAYKHRNYDIFVYDALAQTVLALPAVNSFADETNPRLSANGCWLVYETDENGSEDIRAFDLRTQLIDTMSDLNTETWDEEQPDISDDGNLIVYVSNEPGGGLDERRDFHGDGKKGDGKFDRDRVDGLDDKGIMRHHDHFRNSGDSLRLYNTHNGANFIVPIANRGLTDVSWPTISGNGAVIAYSGAVERRDLDDRNKDARWGHQKSFKHETNREILIYSVVDAAQLTPPFVNDFEADQDNPDLNQLGDRITYSSNRRGDYDIYMTDLRSGFTDNLALANSSGCEQFARFLGPLGDRMIFDTDRAGDFRIMVYDFPTGMIDTLPVANEVGSDTQLDSNSNDHHSH